MATSDGLARHDSASRRLISRPSLSRRISCSTGPLTSTDADLPPPPPLPPVFAPPPPPLPSTSAKLPWTGQRAMNLAHAKSQSDAELFRRSLALIKESTMTRSTSAPTQTDDTSALFFAIFLRGCSDYDKSAPMRLIAPLVAHLRHPSPSKLQYERSQLVALEDALKKCSSRTTKRGSLLADGTTMLREALLELRSPTALERVQVLLRLDDLAGKVDESRLTADIELLTDVTRHMSATDAFPALRSLCQQIAQLANESDTARTALAVGSLRCVTEVLNRPRKSERRFSSLLQALAADLASKDDEHLFEAVIRESRSLPLDQLKDGERGRRRSMLQEQLVELKTARKQLTKMVEADSDLSLFVTRQLDGLEGRCSSLSRRMNASMMAFEAVPARFGEDAHMRIAPEAFFGLLDSVVPVLQSAVDWLRDNPPTPPNSASAPSLSLPRSPLASRSLYLQAQSSPEIIARRKLRQSLAKPPAFRVTKPTGGRATTGVIRKPSSSEAATMLARLRREATAVGEDAQELENVKP